MSDNLAAAREVLATLGERDADKLIALSHPDVEWYSLFALSEKGVYRGHEGTRRYMRDLNDAFEISRATRTEVHDALAIGDIVLLVGRIHYRGKGSGVESTSRVGWTLKFRQGKLVRFRAFRDPEQVLEGLGRAG
jgi:ketosteroid isomerase-like protein